MSRANSGVSECNEFPDLQRILNFYLLKNLASNELFLLFSYLVPNILSPQSPSPG